MMNGARWLLSVLVLVSAAVGACSKDGGTPPAASGVAAPSGHEQRVDLQVTADGFVPATIKVRAGHPVKLVVTRKVDKTCATDIVIKDFAINAPLPLDKPVELSFIPSAPGKHRFSCGMDMLFGDLVVE